ncbi:hypothetical protein [Mucilaginibacter psychrotolerans]|uniref:DUF1440 domain-containing protein n=1 Tax=Mucilaginibacter psychrotolerans TaxID=1524096 RepID=A0A4Y8SM51_9SPHI|nr:hypothetical protein [Mucilaginibacter psychrotolerans]TFF39711.1 hypothetical protein E2R66_04915 [Mucilaginibacter psychrotolerans]
MLNKKSPNLLLTGILAALIAGTLDALAAVFILAHGQAASVFHYIAAAAIGLQASFGGGNGTVLLGLAIHYLIAGIFTWLFFILYNKIAALRKNAGLIAFIYGIVIWLIMNLLVLPLSKINIDFHRFTFKGFAIGAAILIVFVALPIVLTRYWYENQKVKVK